MAMPPKVDMDKQGKHVRNHKNFIPTKSVWASGIDHEAITQEAWVNGTPVPGQPQARSYNAGRPVGENGETWVKVHLAVTKGTIHGHPTQGPKTIR